MCENEIIKEEVSPSGDAKAVVFQRDCGATTGFSTQISIFGSGQSHSESGNAFVGDGGQIVEGWNGPWVEIEWRGQNLLEVRYDASARLFEQANEVDGVEISYVPVRLRAQ